MAAKAAQGDPILPPAHLAFQATLTGGDARRPIWACAITSSLCGVHPVEVPSSKRSRNAREDPMFRHTTYVRFVLVMAVLVALAMFMGSDPWGPI